MKDLTRTKIAATAIHTSTQEKAVSLPRTGCRGWVASNCPHVGVISDFTCDLEPKGGHCLKVRALHEGKATNLHMPVQQGHRIGELLKELQVEHSHEVCNLGKESRFLKLQHQWLQAGTQAFFFFFLDEIPFPARGARSSSDTIVCVAMS